jgi:hypothetical protein
MALKPLPVRDPDTLVRLQRRSPEITTSVQPYPSVLFYREHAKTLSAVIAMMGARLNLEGDTQPLQTNFVTANLFLNSAFRRRVAACSMLHVTRLSMLLR